MSQKVLDTPWDDTIQKTGLLLSENVRPIEKYSPFLTNMKEVTSQEQGKVVEGMLDPIARKT